MDNIDWPVLLAISFVIPVLIGLMNWYAQIVDRSRMKQEAAQKVEMIKKSKGWFLNADPLQPDKEMTDEECEYWLKQLAIQKMKKREEESEER